MKNFKKVAIGLEFSDDMLKVWRLLKGMDFLKDSEIHLIHVGQLIDDEETRVFFQQAALSKMESLIPEILPREFTGQCKQECFASHNPQVFFSEYAERIGANLIILASIKQRESGIGPFIKYVTDESRASILLLKRE